VFAYRNVGVQVARHFKGHALADGFGSHASFTERRKGFRDVLAFDKRKQRVSGARRVLDHAWATHRSVP
jgi:hypothetical protein